MRIPKSHAYAGPWRGVLRRCSLASLALGLSGCGQHNTYLLTHTEIPSEAVSQILLRLRQDLGYYHEQTAARRASAVDPDIPRDQSGNPIPLVCDFRDFDFDISKAEVSLQVSTATKTDGELGLKVPFGPAGIGTFGPDLSGSVSRTATQTLTFDVFDGAKAPPRGVTLSANLRQANKESEDSNGTTQASVTPIANTLIRLRKALIESALSELCLSTVSRDASDKADDSLKVDFVIEKDVHPKVGFDILIVSASLGFDKDRSDHNTLTVSFAPVSKPDVHKPPSKR